jgi:hypothetical protein
MTTRKPAAPHFYAGDCARATERFLQGYSPPEQPARIVAGIVPHAGWVYSGAVAAKVFETIRQKTNPETFIFFGAVHQWPGESAVYARGAWATPLGEIAVDSDLASKILDGSADLASENPAAHNGEHAIEVELPFVKYLFPEAKIVPISVSPDENAPAFGKRVGEILAGLGRTIVIIGSTDLTHYGNVYQFTPAGYGSAARRWQRENDARILKLAEQMKASEIVPEARSHHNACGPGALAATVAAAAVLGSRRGYLVEYTTSFDVAPEPEFRMAVGYAGILY